MKRFVLLFTVMVAMSPFAVWAQADQKGIEDQAERIELKKQQLDLDKRWADLQFQKEMQKIQIEKARSQIGPDQRQPMGFPRHHPPCLMLMMAMCGLVHILLSIWTFQDIRRRNSGSGIWIVVVLLTGFFGTLLYALVRLGDIRAGGSAA